LLPPSGAVCGSFAKLERDAGIWKAPANLALSTVIRPCQSVSNEQQQTLNIHPSGKSINAIRSFPGKGTLIWGARTLAGNDYEWRYINIRRTVIMIEQSVLNALKTLVDTSNDQNLWNKIKSMLENFLMRLWQDGALQGAKPEQAYFVKVGLNITMTTTDIYSGGLVVEFGIAMTKPAEFIVFKLEQQMSKA
jgi:uncharacterized protein